MEKLYECQTCGVISDERSHVCNPKSSDSRAEFCGTASESILMCDTMKESNPFHCENCGRQAEKPSMLCSPIRD